MLSRFNRLAKSFTVKALILLTSYNLSAQTNCLIFDGTDDYVNMGTVSPSGNFSTGFTYMGWTKWGAFNSWSRLFDFGNGSGSDNILLANSGTTNALAFGFYSGTTQYQYVSGNVLPQNQWVHMAASISSAGVGKFYVNGILAVSGTMTTPVNIARAKAYLGKSNWGSDSYFNGSMDEVSFWTKELSQSEIQNYMFTYPVGTETGLYAYYKFNQGTAGGTNTSVTSLLDATANAKSGTLTSFALTGTASNWVSSTLPSSIPDNSLSFDGTSDYVSIPALGNNYTEFTIETWINGSSFTASDYNGIFNTNTYTSGNVHFQIYNKNSIQFAMNGNSTVTTKSFPFATNTWYHVAASYNSTKKQVSIYINGTLIATDTYTTALPANFTAAQIGAWNNSGTNSRYFAGMFDNYRIWSRERTAANIRDSMFVTLKGSENGLLASFDFNQGAGGGTNTGVTTLINSLGTNHGTLNTFTLTGTTSNYVTTVINSNNCLAFDGTDDYVTCGSIDPTQFTVEAWACPAILAKDHAIVSNLNGSGTGMEIHIGSDNKPCLTIGTGSAYTDVVASNTITAGTWVHLAGTFDGSTATLYVNGVQVASKSSLSYSAGTYAMAIGKRASSATYNFNGKVDEVKIWSRSRTIENIRDSISKPILGNETGLLFYSNFNQGIAGGSNSALTSLTNLAGTAGTLVSFSLSGTTSNWVSSTIKQKPTNHATAFTATAGTSTITLKWSDATNGFTTPDGYVLMASLSNNFTDPVDFTDITTDTDMSDGKGVVKIAQGTQSYSGFTNLQYSNLYYFKLYPYTNSGSLITYKTAATVPTTSVAYTKAEPTNHITNFAASQSNGTVTLSWTDESTADGYYIIASTSSSITNPTDGTELTADCDLSDGIAIAKVANGVQTFSAFTNSSTNTSYYFQIYPYSNSGIYTNYKTSGTIPQVSISIPSVSTSANTLPYSVNAIHGYGWADYTNDGKLDLVLNGKNSLYRYQVTGAYTNDGSGGFISKDTTITKLTMVSYGSASWGDYDNDNRMDLLLTGVVNGGSYDNSMTGLYHNNGDGSFTLTTNKFPGLYLGNAAFGDYDKDGFLDLIIAGRTSTPEDIAQIYHNNGDGTFTIQSSINLKGGSYAKTIWTDLNNDGYLDLFLCYSGIHYIYKNNKDNTFSLVEKNNITTGWEYGQSQLSLGDFNNDGYVDVLKTGYSGGSFAKLFKNNHDLTFTEVGSIPSGYYSSGFFADVNNDKYLDVVLDGNVYKNNKNETFTVQSDISLGTAPILGADIDNDGDIDFINANKSIYINNCLIKLPTLSAPENLQATISARNVTLLWKKDTAKNIRYALRFGKTSGGTSIVSPQALSNGTRLSPDYLNLSTDTFFVTKNLLPGTYYWSVQKVNQNGIGSPFTSEQTFKIDSIQASNITAQYISNTSLKLKWTRGNGDGCIVFAKQTLSGCANPKKGTIYKGISTFGYGKQIDSLGTKTGWYCVFNGIDDSVTVSGLSGGTIYSFEVMEYYSRNDSDFYNSKTKTSNIINIGSSLLTERTNFSLLGLNYSSIDWADYDNDGDLDFINAGYYYQNITHDYTSLYKNNGNNNILADTGSSIYQLRETTTNWFDFDNDNDLDLLITGFSYNTTGNNVTKLYRNKNGKLSLASSVSLPNAYGSAVQDFNNDGKIDIIVGNQVYKNNGDTTFTSIYTLNASTDTKTYCADYNNDGLIDIVTTAYGEQSQLFKNKGNFTFEKLTGTIFDNFNDAKMAWGDYNNDGFQDLVIASHNATFDGTGGTINLYLNDGNGGFIEQDSEFLPYVKGIILEWFDYNNDGKLDLFVSGEVSYEVYKSGLFINNGDGTFSKSDLTLPAFANGAAGAGDYDNDGDIDIFFTGEISSDLSITKLYQNNRLGKGGINYNTAANQVTGLSSKNHPGYTTLKWATASDAETPSSSLTYNLKLWNVDSTSNGKVKNYVIIPNSDTLSGYRKVPKNGNVQLATAYSIKNLKAGKYFWQVQAVDGGLKGGLWSSKSSFTVKAAQAYFDADTVCLGDSTSFTDNSVSDDGIKAWTWNFGDTSSVSTLRNPKHKYMHPGNHTVKLVVTNNNSKTDTLVNIVYVKSATQVNFNQAVVCGEKSISLTNNTPTANVKDWHWEFGDNSSSDIANPGSHLYADTGHYTISLRVVSNNACLNTMQQRIVLTDLPSAAITLENGSTTFCAGDSVSYSVPYKNYYKYQWIKDLDTLSLASNKIVIKSGAGAYKVKVTNLRSTVCKTESESKTVVIKARPTVPFILSAGNTSFCSGDSVLLSITSQTGVTYNWKLNGGTFGSNSNQVYAKTGGAYDLSLTNESDCSVSSINSINVVAFERPGVPAISTKGSTTLCSGDSIILSTPTVASLSYQWQLNGSTTVGSNSEYNAKVGGTYSLIASNTNNCSTKSTSSVSITVNPRPDVPTINYTGSTTFCIGTSLTLSTNQATDVSYQWKRDGGLIGSGTIVEANQSGKYSLIAYYSLTSCQNHSADSVKITINPKPEIPALNYGATEFCLGNSISFSTENVSGLSYQWKNGNDNIVKAINNQYTASTSGSYWLYVKNSYNCSAQTNPIEVKVFDIPSTPAITASKSTILCQGDSLSLSTDLTSSDSYQWMKDGAAISGANSKNLTVKAAGSYSIKITNAAGCFSTSNVIAVTVNPKPEMPSLSYGNTSFCKGESVSFSTTAVAGLTYLWKNGNEYISASSTNQYTASTSGTYSLLVKNSYECSVQTNAIAVVVGEIPSTPAITASKSTILCQGDSLSLSTDLTSSDSYQWMKDGAAISGANSKNLTVKAAGSYSLKITNAAGCFSTSNVIAVTVNPKPEMPSLSYGVTSFCQGGSVTFSTDAVSGLTYLWKNGNESLSASSTTQYTARATGNYSLIVKNSFNCAVQTSAVAVFVSEIPSTPVISANKTTTLCQGDSITLSTESSSTDNYQWLRDGATISGATAKNITVKNAGTYSLQLTNAIKCYSTSNAIAVVINPKPSTPSLSYGATSFCQGGSVTFSTDAISGLTYTWKNGNETISASSTNQYTATQSGNYLLQVKNSAECTAQTQAIAVTVIDLPNVPIISLTGASAFCSGDSSLLQITAQSGVSYNWKLENGALLTSGSFYYAKYTGNIQVEAVSNQLGCISKSTQKQITVYPAPDLFNIKLSGQTIFCEGDSLTLTTDANSAYTYVWKNEENEIAGTSSSNLTVKKSGKYSLVVQTSQGCTRESSQLPVYVYEKPATPEISITSGNSSICPGDQVIIDITQASAQFVYQWSRNGIQMDNDTITKLKGPLKAGDYTVTAINGTCKATSNKITISEKSAPAKPEIYAKGPKVWIVAVSNDSAKAFHWYYNGQLLEGVNAFKYTAKQNLGQYYCEINEGGECWTASDVIDIPSKQIVSETDEALSSELKVFPNPSDGIFTISSEENLTKASKFEISNIQGQKIKFTYKSLSSNSLELDLKGYPSGIYVLQYQVADLCRVVKLVIK